MKTRYYILAFILCLRSAANLQAQLTNNELSYIRSRTISSADSSQYLDRIDYFDGLGRPVQSVRKAFSPAGKDLVNLLEYDMAGREVQNWLSAESSLATGASLAPDVFKAKAQTAYGDAKPYGYTLYEPSPLNRPLAQFGPGADWHNNGKAVKTAYGTNTSTAELSCAYYTVGNNTLVKSGDYAPNQLFVTKTTDEDGAAAYEFKNKQEQLLLSRRINGAAMHDTYYVYDDYGNLAYALTPEAASLLAENGAWADGNTVMANLAYLYKYDHRNRCIAKKLPGADWTYYIYDKADRLIFSQDGERRAKGEWLFSIPDALGRPTVTG
ncbi:MAG: DUF6443 domain-containing protein, partial [Prevotellaceae bacterium]|nr:DUF6443 domain-containing protein [Prevotellaceae bacterium]